MPVSADNEEYYPVAEACEYLGGVSPHTLRLRARANHISPYKRGLTKKIYYRRSDLDRIMAFRPVIREDDHGD